MKYALLLLIPIILIAENKTREGYITFNDLVYRPQSENLKVGISVDSDTTQKIVSIDNKVVKIERTYNVKDTLIYKR